MVGSSGLSPSRLPNSQPRPSSTTLIADKYRYAGLGEELGRGAFGQVFRGLDTRTGEHVAIKQLNLEGIADADLQGIVNEVELLRSLSHRNVVKYLGSARTRSSLYIVLEYMENGSLASVIKQSGFGPFPEALVAVYVQQVLQGLAYLHERGVVHRDVKGANILTTKDGVVKLADFGVAAQLEQLEAASSSGRDAVPAGSPYWMAPEVVQLRAATPAADIWGVGALAVELLTGDPPYAGLQPMSALYNIVSDPHPPLPGDVSAAMTDFLTRCFARDPTTRPSARDLLAHPWITYNRRTLRSTWSRTRGARSRGSRADAHASVAAAVERLLRAEEGSGEDEDGAAAAGAGAGAQAPPPSPAAAALGAGAKAGASNGPPTATPTPAASPGGASSPPRVPPRFDGNGGAGSLTPLRVALDDALDEEAEDATGAALLARLRAEDDTSAEGDSVSPASRRAGREPGISRDGARGEPSPGASPGDAPGSPPRGTARSNDTAAAVARQVASLRVAPPGERRNVPRDAAAAASASALAALVSGVRGREAAAAFEASDGFAALDELFAAGSDRALRAGAELLAALASADAACLRASCDLGLLPGALRASGPDRDPGLRLALARVARTLCARDAGARALVAAGCLPDLVALLRAPRGGDTDALNGLDRTRAVVDAVWALLRRADAPGWTLSVVALLRRLAFHGLAEALIAAVPVVLAAHEAAQRAARPDDGVDGTASGGVASGGGGAPPDQGRQGRAPPRALSPLRSSSSGPRISIGSPSPSPAGSRGARGAELAAESAVGLTPAESAALRLGTLLTGVINLLAALVQGDGSARARVASPAVLRPLFSLTARLPAPLALTVVSSVRRLTRDPAVADALDSADGVAFLAAQLARGNEASLTAEALAALHNLCVSSRERQEQAAVAGAVPFLCRLALLPHKGAEAEIVHELSVGLLCSLAQSSARSRAELWAHDALSVLLHLLKEEAYQPPVLDALAAWLGADAARVEARLVTGDALTRLVTLLPAMAGAAGEGDNLAATLRALHGLLDRSSRLATELAQNGLTPRVTELLRRPGSPAGLPALALLGLLARRHPRAREFAAKYRVQATLNAVAAGAGSAPGAPARAAAQTLLEDLVARGIIFP